MNVVIVDDTPLNLSLLKAMVSKLPDCTAVVFQSPIEGLNWCLDNDVDLLIVDYMMPELDGIEFIRRLRARPDKAEIPVLMVTASIDRQVRYDALEAGATDFLTKPVDTYEFRPRVRNMLELRRNQLIVSQRAFLLAEEVAMATAEIHAREQETVMRLARAAEFRDPETGAHIQRMSYYSALIARQLGLAQDVCTMLLQAAPMHDVGKLGTPDHILLKPGKLTPEEFEIMKQHTTIGWEILGGSASPMLRMAADIAYSHHERFDGEGYPRRLKGDEIPLTGRIVTVADVFDALTSVRPYKKAWSMDEARQYLADGRGAQFDPDCVDAFMAKWDEVETTYKRYRDD